MHVENKSLDFMVKRVDQMNDSQITKGRGRFKKKTIR
jgi:hypothetical protein